MDIKTESFGKLPDGTETQLFTLSNDNGLSAKITNYGGILVEMNVPDKKGKTNNVQLGFGKVEDYISDKYLKNCPYFGAVIGRYGNRIKEGKFSLEGKEYTLPINNGPNSLHGGITGFDKKVWQTETLTKEGSVALLLTLHSPDGEEGYPANLDVTMTYELNNDNELKFDYQALTDAPTVVNLTQHSYWNLSGAGNCNITEHVIKINADRYTLVDDNLIPTGEIAQVADTPFDFTTAKPLSKDIFNLPFGYDHNFVIKSPSCSPEEFNDELNPIAEVYDPESGRFMEVSTNQPGVQLYTAYYLDGSLKSPSKLPYDRFAGLCLETQHFPDSPNKSEFPSTTLNPGEKYHHITIHKFTVK